MLKQLRKPAWLAAMAAYAMLLVLQFSHSPLHHHGPHAHCEESAALASHNTDAADATPEAHGSCTHHGGHSAAPAQTHSHGCPQPCSGGDLPEGPHGHDCHLCQFLSQSIAPLTVPVSLEQQDLVQPADPLARRAIVAVERISHPPRGPPSIG